ncbi:hypothetical protein C3Y87_20695 [Carbonactinospora thermoautotrophica]|uniref:hypothetical protein n=1 Tax=Carbonactinospora thermoautotrophica TaxID=1469144 RepID=UPI00226EDB9C|nr:hypothetical protein [Carbonactinospora thermoautotrophica]MCX9193753.1 hypothetical protein [Carbonactinospora thermoautotrophica]
MRADQDTAEGGLHTRLAGLPQVARAHGDQLASRPCHDPLWRIKSSAVLPGVARLADGSSLPWIVAARDTNRRADPARVIEYPLDRGADDTACR